MIAGDLILRPTSDDDLSEIESIELACFSSDPWPRQSFESFMDRPGVTFMVAEDSRRDGRIAGYGVLIHALDEAELLNLAVSDESRRRGVGSALLIRLLDSARSRGVRTVYLEVRESNAAARALYGSHGFVEVGRRRAYYQRPVEDALILQRAEG
ncbi:MAG: ribosomal protein S18-alanine N-acetyltransferase [Gemmatimonadaceae bacterium]